MVDVVREDRHVVAGMIYGYDSEGVTRYDTPDNEIGTRISKL